MASLSTTAPANSSRMETTRKSVTPPLWRSDSRPDPSVLSQDERLREFGKLMLRAIERKAAKKVKP